MRVLVRFLQRPPNLHAHLVGRHRIWEMGGEFSVGSDEVGDRGVGHDVTIRRRWIRLSLSEYVKRFIVSGVSRCGSTVT
jgi:hypothetical protein